MKANIFSIVVNLSKTTVIDILYFFTQLINFNSINILFNIININFKLFKSLYINIKLNKNTFIAEFYFKIG